MQLTKAQKLMVADGFPASLFQTPKQRAAYWASNPKLGVIPTSSFKDPKVDKYRKLRLQLEREETALRIQKMLGGQARKAQLIRKADIRGKRWDSRHNKWIPIDPQESHMNDDTKAANGDQATAAPAAPTSVAEKEVVMSSTAKKTVSKSRKSAKKAKKVVKAKGNGARKSNGKTRTPRGESKTAVIAAMLKRASGCTRAQVLAATNWKAVSMQQIAENLGVKLSVSDERPFVYKAK